MRTRISLALGPRRKLSRQTAWGCFTTNLALPGFGSLLAGYVSGYFQAALSLGGMALTLLFGVRFISWYLKNLARFGDLQGDPVELMTELWTAARLPLFGIALFAIGWLWALATGLYIVRKANDSPAAGLPPKLDLG